MKKQQPEGIDFVYERARIKFWEFCKLLAPDFYKYDHLKVLCETLEKIYRKELLKDDGTPYTKLMINMPPQFGKSRTMIMFCMWLFGICPTERIIAASYNDTKAVQFSKYTRDGIQEQKSDHIVYSDIFDSKIKTGDASQSMWALQGQHFSYMGTGMGGSLTGQGGTVLIIDDPVKGAEEALNANHLEKIWTWYTGTFISRVSAEGGEPLQIIIHTRWAKNDLSGRILAESKDWYVLKMEAVENGKMLCDDLLSKEAYEDRKSLMLKDFNTAMIFWSNYHQKTIDVGNKMYKGFKTYSNPPIFEAIRSYTDTADTGDDYLCSIKYGEYRGQAYVLDVLYTQEPMEITEPLTADMMQDVHVAVIESNNGGRGFARAVEKICEEKRNNLTVFNWFHQSKNKDARINSMSSWIVQNMFFPENWMDRWPEFYEAMTAYQRIGKNKFDDAPDAATGIAEQLTEIDEIIVL